jgi:hypothetical protein
MQIVPPMLLAKTKPMHVSPCCEDDGNGNVVGFGIFASHMVAGAKSTAQHGWGKNLRWNMSTKKA